MAFDFKKAYKELYQPGTTPSIVNVPPMRFVAVRGEGDPNAENGAYQSALALLYAVSYTLKMSGRAGHPIENAFEYVVPPLEGLWRQDGTETLDLARKEDFRWISLIRLPDFVGPEDLDWAKSEVERRKKIDAAPAEFLIYEEGLCVQCMHVGPYDDEPITLSGMRAFIAAQDLEEDNAGERRHHEIYLGDPRRCAPERLRTVIRLPVKPREA